MAKYILRLYITGPSSRSKRALANLETIVNEVIGERYELHVIDVLENPEMAEADKIVATPTLIKIAPEPARRIIGDMSDRDKVMLALDIIN